MMVLGLAGFQKAQAVIAVLRSAGYDIRSYTQSCCNVPAAVAPQSSAARPVQHNSLPNSIMRIADATLTGITADGRRGDGVTAQSSTRTIVTQRSRRQAWPRARHTEMHYAGALVG